eukprot:jgi/Orpsp1_1/1183544/evm.model.c7180000085673.1
MTVALNNNVDMNKLINSNGNNNFNDINNGMKNNNPNSSITTTTTTNTTNVTTNNNNENNNNNNINLNNALLSQEFLLQLLQQQQQLQLQLQQLQQQQQQLQQQKLNETNNSNEGKLEGIPIVNSNNNNNGNVLIYNNGNLNQMASSFPKSGVRTNENTQELNNYYQYFSKMYSNSVPKVEINSEKSDSFNSNNYHQQQLYLAQKNQGKMNSLPIPSSYNLNTLSISSSPYATSIPTSYAMNPNILPLSPIGINASLGGNERNIGDFRKQEFTKPPKIPSHLISSSLISSGLLNINNNN